jgi:hypothetical protein
MTDSKLSATLTLRIMSHAAMHDQALTKSSSSVIFQANELAQLFDIGVLACFSCMQDFPSCTLAIATAAHLTPRMASGLALVPFKLFAARTGTGTGASACALCHAGTYSSSTGASGW